MSKPNGSGKEKKQRIPKGTIMSFHKIVPVKPARKAEPKKKHHAPKPAPKKGPKKPHRRPIGG
ncbi:hypothetical protein [Streptomyces iranensis]|uniref:Uncharacterized protein n=1 Tax=Streptomyces iranensis TaxID=576784 RepID=A0ABS4N7K4_9ACTN|nr:hypothetical protein [Streptomyces iranensis]MBP2067995.1 hypothetical protein [Streptomyces iranensis]